MAKISSKDIFEGDFLAKQIEQAQLLQKVIRALAKDLKVAAENSKKILASKKTFGSAEDIDKVEQEIKQVNKVTEENLKLKKQEEALTKKLISLQKQRATSIATTKVQIQESNTVLKQNAIINNNVTGAYKRQSTLLIVLRTRFKNLAAQNKGNTAESKRLLSEITKLDAKLKQIDRSVGQNQREVGNYTGALGKLRLGLLRVTGTLGITGNALSGLRSNFIRVAQAAGATLGVFGAFKLIKGAIGIVRDFDESLADITKTTGLSKEAARALSEELFKIDTRTSVTSLLELATAAGRLGLQEDEIVGFVEATDKVFVALGDSLEGTAEEIGLTLGKLAANFDLDKKFGVGEAITKVGSALNELGATTKAQEGAIINFTKRISGVAVQAGIALPDILALGTLFDATGQSIEVAATTLNKLLPAIGKDVAKFAKVAGINVEKFTKIVETDAIEALKLVAIGAKSNQEGLLGLSETLANYGIESGRAASILGILSDNVDTLTEIQETSNKAFEENISVSKEFNQKNTTLNATIEKLGNEWTKLVLSFETGAGQISGPLTTAITFLTQNLVTILKVIGGVAAAFVAFKVAVFATNAIQKANIVTTRIWGVITGLATKKIKLATIAQRAFNLVAKANPIGLLIAGLTAAAIAFGIFSDKGDDATDTEEDFNKEAEKTNRVLVRRLELLKLLKKGQDLSNITLVDLEQSLGSANEELKNLSSSALTAQQIFDGLFDTGLETLTEAEVFIRERLIAEIDRLEKAIADKRRALGLDKTEVKDRKSLIEIQKQELKLAKLRPETTENELRVKNRLIKSINEEISRLQALGIEKEKVDKAQEKRDEEFMDRIDAELEAQEEIIKEAEEIGKSLERIENDRFENEKKRLGLLDENGKLKEKLTEKNLEALESLEKIHSEKVLEILKIRHAKAADLAFKARQEEEEDEAKANALRLERQQQIVDAITDIARKGAAERISIIDKEIADREKREAQLLELAARGSEDATDNLAFEQQKQAELRLARERELKRQQKIELGLTALNTYNSKVQAGEKNALGATIRDITLLAAFVSSLPAFYEGIEDTGRGGAEDSKGGFIAKLHPRERIMTAEQNKRVKGLSNDQLADVGQLYKEGMLGPTDFDATTIVHKRFREDAAIVNGIEKMVQKLDELPSKIDIPESRIDYNAIEESIVKTVKRRSGTTKYWKKVNKLY